MPSRPRTIAVVGAGPAGLAATIYLNRLGHRVTLLEQFARPGPVGSGLMLQPTGLAVLHELGLADAVLALAQRIDRLHGTDARSGRTVLDVAYRGGAFGLALHRSLLFDTLYAEAKHAARTIEMDQAISGAEERADGVWLRVGTHGRRHGPFDLVIDAAGAHSPLRDRAQRGAEAVPLAYGAFWTTLTWPDPAPRGISRAILQQRYRRARTMIGVLPLGRASRDGEEQVAFFWSVKPDEVPDLKAAGLSSWTARVVALWPEIAPLVDQIESFDDLTLARYGHHTMARPHRGRVLHIGDSAHATSPQLGQGVNMALLDACAVARAMVRAPTLDDVGAHYAAMRRWHVRVFQFASRALTPFYQSDGVVLPMLRDTLVASVARVPPMPAVLASLVSGTLADPFHKLSLAPRPAITAPAEAHDRPTSARATVAQQ